MTEHSIETLMFKSSDEGVFDTPKARHHLTAKSGWLTFYTVIKLLAATMLAIFIISDAFDGIFQSEGRFWEEALMQAMMAAFGLAVFLAFEKSVFWGLRAYQDAIRRNEALEKKIKEGSAEPIYVAVIASEKSVPATKDRLLSLLFIWSKYLVFLIYTGAIGFFTFILFIEGASDDPVFLLEAFIFGPVIVFFIARWVFQSEKEIRLNFSGNATLQSDFEELRARNAELESELQGFEGVSRGDKEKLEQKIHELNENASSSQASSAEYQRQIDELKEQLKAQRSAIAERDTAYDTLSKEIGGVEELLEQEQLARSTVETRLKNLSAEFGKNCTVDEAFKALNATVGREGGLGKLDGNGLSLLAKLMRDIRSTASDNFSEAKSLSFVSPEEQRINQYDAIVRLYSRKIQNLRSSDMDEEEQQDAIDAMRRLRDREIAELEGSS